MHPLLVQHTGIVHICIAHILYYARIKCNIYNTYVYIPLYMYILTLVFYCVYTYITNNSMCTTTSYYRVLQGISLFYAVTLAFMSPHMEIRFLLPCLPFLHLAAGAALRELLLWATSSHHRWYTLYAYVMPIMIIEMPILCLL